MMAEYGLNLESELASSAGDKFARAQPVAAAWNAKQVHIRSGALWADAFVSEVVGFTGVNDRHDDQVDALASAFQAMTNSIPIRPPPRRPQGYRLGTARGIG